MISIGHLFGKGFFVYAETPSKRISKYMDEPEARKFGKKLAESTMQEFDENLQYFDGDDCKKVVSQQDINREMAFKMIEQTSREEAGEYLDKLRKGESLDVVSVHDGHYSYANGIDFN
jgi:hypothetical protein